MQPNAMHAGLASCHHLGRLVVQRALSLKPRSDPMFAPPVCSCDTSSTTPFDSASHNRRSLIVRHTHARTPQSQPSIDPSLLLAADRAQLSACRLQRRQSADQRAGRRQEERPEPRVVVITAPRRNAGTGGLKHAAALTGGGGGGGGGAAGGCSAVGCCREGRPGRVDAPIGQVGAHNG